MEECLVQFTHAACWRKLVKGKKLFNLKRKNVATGRKVKLLHTKSSTGWTVDMVVKTD